MTLSEHLKVLAETKAVRCTVAEVLSRLDAQDAEALEVALRDEFRISVNALHRVLRQEGIQVDRGVLAKHRYGRCACAVEAL